MEQKLLQEAILEKEPEIQIQHYATLNLIARDSYIFYEDAHGVTHPFRGMIWSQKTVHDAGMTEFLLLQEFVNGKFQNWHPFLFRSHDRNISAVSLFDIVPRHSVDPSAGSRITKLGFGVSWTFIGILLYVLIANVQIDTTITFFLMIFGFILSITIAFFYEMKRKNEDMVYTAKIFQDAPSVAISRSYLHPISGKLQQVFGEVPVIAIKSSKNTFASIRGYTVQEMHDHLTYAREIQDFKKQIYLYEIQKHKFDELNGEISSEDKELILNQLLADEEKIKATRHALLKKHGDFATSESLDVVIRAAHEAMQDEQLRQKIDEELQSERAEIEDLHTQLSQTQLERDKYEKEAQSWMKSANSDVNKFNIVVAAKLAKILKEGALVDLYEPAELPNHKSSISALNAGLLSAMSGFLPFVFIFAIAMMIFNSIKHSLASMGEWASFLYIIFVTVVAIGIGIFLFGYTKSRMKDIMNNTESSRKVVPA